MQLTRYDLAYRALLGVLTPVTWLRPRLREKLGHARAVRNGEVEPRRGEGPCVLIHAVSVGEVNATCRLVQRLLEEKAGLTVVVSVTTDTGFARAEALFAGAREAGRVRTVRYPLDLSGMVRRFLDALRPDVAVLMELEVWPNFVAECGRRGIPVLLVNGRMTERSFKGFRRVRPLVGPMYRGLWRVAAQEEAYGERFRALGVPPERVEVTGTMKFDSAHVGERVEGDSELAEALGLSPRALGGVEPVLVCGSTGPGEEGMLLEVFAALRKSHPALRLVIVPRKPERFDEVSDDLSKALPVLRRSTSRIDALPGSEPSAPIILGDTMGELRKFYSLADIVVVGRTLVDLGEKQHGSDMIEPAALGKPVVVGPYTGNFAEPMRALLAGEGIVQVKDADEMLATLDDWLKAPEQAAEVGRRAREVVVRQQGATERHVALVVEALKQSSCS